MEEGCPRWRPSKVRWGEAAMGRTGEGAPVTGMFALERVIQAGMGVGLAAGGA